MLTLEKEDKELHIYEDVYCEYVEHRMKVHNETFEQAFRNTYKLCMNGVDFQDKVLDKIYGKDSVEE